MVSALHDNPFKHREQSFFIQVMVGLKNSRGECKRKQFHYPSKDYKQESEVSSEIKSYTINLGLIMSSTFRYNLSKATMSEKE